MRHESNVIDQVNQFKNIFTRPWIGDLDDDGYLDIVYAQYYNNGSFLTSFLGMRARRISTAIRMKKPLKWGSYMGSKGDGIFSLEK